MGTDFTETASSFGRVVPLVAFLDSNHFKSQTKSWLGIAFETGSCMMECGQGPHRNGSPEQTMKIRYGYRRPRVKTWELAALCAAGLVLGLLTRTDPFYLRPQPPVALLVRGDTNTLCCLKRVTVPWYLRSGQWQADIRSLAAVWRYLTDADLAGQTNGSPATSRDV